MCDLIVAYRDCRSIPRDGDACLCGGRHGQVSGSIGDYKYSTNKPEKVDFTTQTLAVNLSLIKSHQLLVFR